MRGRKPGAAFRRARGVVVPAALAALVMVVAACGKSSSDTQTTASGGSTSSASTASGCGTVPTLPFKDESGVIASLPDTYKQAYNGYADTVYKSPWADFKPKGSRPYTIGVSVTQPINSFQGQLIPLLTKALKGVDGVGKVSVLTSPPTGLTTQIQQANQLIQRRVDVLVTEPLVGPAFASVAARAGKAGIPMLSIINSTPSPYSIDLAPNGVADGAASGAQLAKMIGGKGTVLGVHGIASTAVDKQEFAGWKASFAKCPDITFDDSLVGQFQPPVAKAKVLSYLSSHPKPVAGAVNAAGMTIGIMQAFQQTGRKVPAMVDVAPTYGTLAYWNENKEKGYKAVGLTVPPGEMARAIADVTGRLLSGHGPKVSDLVQNSVSVTDSNLSDWVKSGAELSDATVAEGPPNTFLTSDYLDPLFNG
jgi:ribose transport system substrate-binding protein